MFRDLVRGKATLRATLVGTVDGIPNRWLAQSNEISIYLEEPLFPEITGGRFQVAWRDFAKTGEGQRPIDPIFHQEPHYVDPDNASGPVIYLNERLKFLDSLIGERPGRSPFEKAIREIAMDQIASATIIALANAALNAVAVEEEEIDFPSSEWQAEILKTLLPSMYPSDSLEQALGKAALGIRDPDNAGRTQALLVASVSRFLNTSKHFERVTTTLDEGAIE